MRAVLSCRPKVLVSGLLMALVLVGCGGREPGYSTTAASPAAMIPAALSPATGAIPAGVPAGARLATPATLTQAGSADGADIVSTGDVLEVSFFLVDTGPEEVDAYLVQIGDILRVDVAEHPELSRDEVLVLPDGTMALPLVGSLDVAGRTVENISQRVLARYEAREIITPGVTVAVVRTRAAAVGDGGALAGGDNAIRVPVFEGQSIELPFIPPVAVDRPLVEIRQDIQQAYLRQFGPRVRVTVNLAERRDRERQAFVMGAVVDPGPVRLEPNMTALMAIASAGGLTREANRNRITLVRLRPDGGYDYLPLALATEPGAGDSGVSAISLAENDVIFVEPRRPLLGP